MDRKQKEGQFILWFDQISVDDVDLVGGKNASLGEMYSQLTQKGISVPNGFAITSKGYWDFINSNRLAQQIDQLVNSIDLDNLNDLAEKGHKIREMIRNASFPEHLREAIVEAYKHLCIQYGKDADVAVRSSATAEDLADASFAGQQETYLNIRGDDMLLNSIKNCFASLFTNRAIVYRANKGFNSSSIALSVGVQKMVRADKGASGVMFTLDTESGFDDVIFITAIYGLGENIVQGRVNPDEYYVFKPTFKQGYRSILSKKLGSKSEKLVYAVDGNKRTKNIPVSEEDQKRFVLSDDEILKLANWAMIIEDHYSEKRGKKTFMDMEWAKDGLTNELFIVQARPETVHSIKNKNVLEKYILKEKSKVLCEGMSVGSKIGTGIVSIIKDPSEIDSFVPGSVLVTEMTDPDWNPIMKKASSIITNKGGRTCHAAIVSRELGIPCVVGTVNATEVLKNGQEVTVDCSSGEKGYVYEGKLDFHIEKHELDKLPQTNTKIMINLGNPDVAFSYASLPVDGVGLVREEFIVNSYIKVHPLALLNFKDIQDENVKKEIEEITLNYESKPEFFKDMLAQGIATIAAAFYPKKVIVRLSDFKSNEYAGLIGGRFFEPNEENPMLGWRGASRYYSEEYKAAFELECASLKRVRDEIGLNNVQIMVPFCRTVDEGKKVIEILANNGLRQGENGLEIYAMCEVPSNVVLADEFLEVFDGFSIGTNDLTQLVLGLDRDSGYLSSLYDEENPAVVRLVESVIKTTKSKGKYIGLCGQAPSDKPDFVRLLVNAGIDSISLNPDAVIKTKMLVSDLEKGE
ncbi:MAG: pyruvate, water dikinase [Candidatus Woesearchaeota archaeon]|nr:pyruvate, water dikinase [Candidatus Woesearchaeota archaeon]